jgi:preprotein translocase subunit YajC
MVFQHILLQAGGGSQYAMPIMLGLMFVVMYFFMIRPQQKKQKEQEQYRTGIKKGDYVVTVGGVHGRVDEIGDNDTVILNVGNGTRMRFEKSSISAEMSKKHQESDYAK